MPLIEKLFAGAMLAACLLLLLRLALGPRRRARFDAAVARGQSRLKRRLGAAASRGQEARAAREARQAIERARRAAAEGEWDGNVYRPKSFKRRKRDLH